MALTYWLLLFAAFFEACSTDYGGSDDNPGYYYYNPYNYENGYNYQDYADDR